MEMARLEEERKQMEMAQKEKNQKTKKLQNRLDRMTFKEKQKQEAKVKKEIILGNENVRSPIICILGHVDTGKTKILDKLRESNVQAGEAGGITQQIGATYFPLQNVNDKFGITSTLPGILVIDTPGHESFSNLRSRGSSLCDLAILVVDVMHLLEPQTIESINLLKMRKTPFVVALNKIDRCLTGVTKKFADCDEKTRKNAEIELKNKVDETITKFAEINLNARLFSENKNPKSFISLVPTSAITGDGLPDLVKLIFTLCESFMAEKMKFKEKFECVILEVKNLDGHGTTIDCILVNGRLAENDKIVIAGFGGPIVTRVKSILVPQPFKEMRVKTPFLGVKSAKASVGLKIVANGLENAVAGSKVIKVVTEKNEIVIGDEKNNEINAEEKAKVEVMEDFNSSLKNIKIVDDGVHVQASTLGSLEALVSFLEKENIGVCSFNIGNVNKSDIIRCSSLNKKGVMLCFDVHVEKEMAELAKTLNVTIFEAEIIYHLLDKYKKYLQEKKETGKTEHQEVSIFPCELSIVPDCIFTTRTPLIIGVEVKRGKCNLGIPVFVEKNGQIEKLGKIVSIEKNKKNLNVATKGDKVAIKIDSDSKDGHKMFGRHFVESDLIYSLVSRKSIDFLKTYFKDELKEEEIRLLMELKRKLDIN